MRLLLFAFMALFGSSAIYAQEPDPELAFVKEGKIWNCVYFYSDKPDLYYSYIIEGDTACVWGENYKKVWIIDEYQFGDAERHYFGAVRQEGDYVYLLEKDSKLEYMLYDYGIRKGGILTLPHDNDVYCLRSFTENPGKLEIKGITRKCSTLYPYLGNHPDWYFVWRAPVQVYEGIGTNMDDPFCIGKYFGFYPQGHFLESCYEGETCIYTKDWYLDDISGVKADTRSEGKDKDGIYDLQGRRLPSVPQKGAYIKDGKVVVNN